MVEGHEVEGRQYTVPPVPQPKTPGLPDAPKKPEPVPLVTEVWMSTTLHIAVLSRISGPFGKQTCHCKNSVAGEPDPALFRIPPDYKTIGAPPR